MVFNKLYHLQIFRKFLPSVNLELPIGHSWVLQVCVSVAFPVQLNPPFDGGGLVQFLVWF
jgi:hypothetical protein